MSAITLGRRAVLQCAAATPATVGHDAKLLATSRDLAAAHHALLASFEPFYDLIGEPPPEALAEQRRALQCVDHLVEQLAETPATTMVGMRAKADALLRFIDPVAQCDTSGRMYCERLGHSLARDLAGAG